MAPKGHEPEAPTTRQIQRMKTAAGIFITALLASAQPAPARSPDSLPHDAIFIVTRALVQVDAVVTDSQGRRITDLAPEDFEVFEDGHPRS